MNQDLIASIIVVAAAYFLVRKLFFKKKGKNEGCEKCEK
jgi:hypothetical protein